MWSVGVKLAEERKNVSPFIRHVGAHPSLQRPLLVSFQRVADLIKFKIPRVQFPPNSAGKERAEKFAESMNVERKNPTSSLLFYRFLLSFLFFFNFFQSPPPLLFLPLLIPPTTRWKGRPMNQADKTER